MVYLLTLWKPFFGESGYHYWQICLLYAPSSFFEVTNSMVHLCFQVFIVLYLKPGWCRALAGTIVRSLWRHSGLHRLCRISQPGWLWHSGPQVGRGSGLVSRCYQHGNTRADPTTLCIPTCNNAMSAPIQSLHLPTPGSLHTCYPGFDAVQAGGRCPEGARRTRWLNIINQESF